MQMDIPSEPPLVTRVHDQPAELLLRFFKPHYQQKHRVNARFLNN
jgi:hypothetical protein